MTEHWAQIPLLKYSSGRVLFYKKNLIEIGDPQLTYSPCKTNVHVILWSGGKESTEVQITQNKGKEREKSYRKLKRSP